MALPVEYVGTLHANDVPLVLRDATVYAPNVGAAICQPVIPNLTADYPNFVLY
jgi:hypothetical protein